MKPDATQTIMGLSDASKDRYAFCSSLIHAYHLTRITEVGVYRGDFAERILKSCPEIEHYNLIDPWRNLSDWNKPANQADDAFERLFQEAQQKTAFAGEKRTFLRGKTTEVIGSIADGSQDLIYIDGDHTLRGITIDLIQVWPKLKAEGFIMGDDFNATVWHHGLKYEPTLVFPFAVYFAEAMNVKIFALPHAQFLIPKSETGFELIDLTKGKYGNTTLQQQILGMPLWGIAKLLKKKVGL